MQLQQYIFLTRKLLLTGSYICGILNLVATLLYIHLTYNEEINIFLLSNVVLVSSLIDLAPSEVKMFLHHICIC
jgi:hypothetical protein